MTLPPAGAARPSRRRAAVIAGVILLVVLAGAAWWSTGPFAGPDVEAVEPPPPVVEPAAPEPSPIPEPDPPSDAVVALADEAFLSEDGRALLYGTNPEILGAQEFAGRCERHTTPRMLPTAAVGCFNAGTNTMVVYAPADPRLRGFVVETVAHETLHAAWEELDAPEQEEMTVLLEAEIAAQPADSRIHEQIAGSIGDSPESRSTELFAYIGTQVWREGGLAPRLESVYARSVADRAALVGVHTGWRALLEGITTDIAATQEAFAEQQRIVAQQRAQHQGDTASVENYRQTYQQKAAEVAAMPDEERERLQLGWTWWDGTELPMAPADQTLATAADLLARDDAALAARHANLTAEEAAVAAERTRIEALIADYNALNSQLDPSGA
ncbi:hypothetical protein [Actinotalea sp. K2]|uniref:hypothetical protein n=1 Tax=Actinotalea sp. K2 TaxID=2939438 RepID=UPI0020174368|nr:hypothetical protein [Actinotalea sp. K2]MCL3860795.1 hypothetical protein [Actinotalea sp. K2]